MLLDDQIIARSSGSPRQSINRLTGLIAGSQERLNRHDLLRSRFPGCIDLRRGTLACRLFQKLFLRRAGLLLLDSFVGHRLRSRRLHSYSLPRSPLLRGRLLCHHCSSGNRLQRHIALPFNQECRSVLDASQPRRSAAMSTPRRAGSGSRYFGACGPRTWFPD